MLFVYRIVCLLILIERQNVNKAAKILLFSFTINNHLPVPLHYLKPHKSLDPKFLSHEKMCPI